MDDNPEIRDRLNVNKSTYHNKRPRERFICFIRGAKWTKMNQLNGPSPIHDTSTWLSRSIQSIRHVCCCLGMQKNLPWKCFRPAFGHYNFPSTSASQQPWRMRKRYHLLFCFTRLQRCFVRLKRQTTYTLFLWRNCRMCLPNILFPVFMFAFIFHCRSFSPCWPLAFLIFSPPLGISSYEIRLLCFQ